MGLMRLIGNDVYTLENEDVGDIKEIMFDMARCAVHSYSYLLWGQKLKSNKMI